MGPANSVLNTHFTLCAFCSFHHLKTSALQLKDHYCAFEKQSDPILQRPKFFPLSFAHTAEMANQSNQLRYSLQSLQKGGH